MVGVIDVGSDEVETPEQVAQTIEMASKYVPAEHIIASTNCGMAPMHRDVAEAKLVALGAGAALARGEQWADPLTLGSSRTRTTESKMRDASGSRKI
jgi:hypothetical protein